MARSGLVPLLFLLLFGGFAYGSTNAKLDSCIAYYQDGEYQKAVDSLKALLPLISNRAEEAEAYKYLGFSYVMLDMIQKAKDFFRVALEKFPQMTIDTLEVPPNITIVFKQTQLEAKMEKGEILDKEVQAKNEKRIIIASILTATGTIATGTGGYFLYRGYRTYRHYLDVSEPDQPLMDSLFERYTRQFWIGGGATAFGVAQLGIATWLFFRRPSYNTKRVGIYQHATEIGVAVRF